MKKVDGKSRWKKVDEKSRWKKVDGKSRWKKVDGKKSMKKIDGKSRWKKSMKKVDGKKTLSGICFDATHLRRLDYFLTKASFFLLFLLSRLLPKKILF
jgi:hypothetical protein